MGLTQFEFVGHGCIVPNQPVWQSLPAGAADTPFLRDANEPLDVPRPGAYNAAIQKEYARRDLIEKGAFGESIRRETAPKSSEFLDEESR
jgi:hypothetical protein